MLLCETWTDENSILDLNGYERHTLNRTMKKKKTRRNSGGLSIYFKSCLSDGITIIKEDSDDIIW